MVHIGESRPARILRVRPAQLTTMRVTQLAVCANHLDHFTTRLGALPTCFGTGGHVLIIWKLLARLSTSVAADSTTFARRSGERTLARRKSGGKLTALGAVNAKLRRFRVLFLAFRREGEAMLEASFALQLAFGADLGALHEVLRVLAAISSEGKASCKGQEL
jgi:hypothetical protein